LVEAESPCVWPGCFGCSGTHRKLGPEPQSERKNRGRPNVLSIDLLCLNWRCMEPKQRYQEVVLFLSNADEKFDHIWRTYTHGTYQRIRSGFFVYGVHA
jgi:hypothetical protein